MLTGATIVLSGGKEPGVQVLSVCDVLLRKSGDYSFSGRQQAPHSTIILLLDVIMGLRVHFWL